mmetsp:Transcript_22554/g.55599  ORF Transcript_22554/g.55599 Transcript_22554/m.55599 type:complete len:223 (+) Transcript_22554:938-1606(+)
MVVVDERDERGHKVEQPVGEGREEHRGPDAKPTEEVEELVVCQNASLERSVKTMPWHTDYQSLPCGPNSVADPSRAKPQPRRRRRCNRANNIVPIFKDGERVGRCDAVHYQGSGVTYMVLPQHASDCKKLDALLNDAYDEGAEDTPEDVAHEQLLDLIRRGHGEKDPDEEFRCQHNEDIRDNQQEHPQGRFAHDEEHLFRQELVGEALDEVQLNDDRWPSGQ